MHDARSIIHSNTGNTEAFTDDTEAFTNKFSKIKDTMQLL